MATKRILLVNPWIVDFAAHDFWMKPVGLLMIGRLLKQAGYQVELLDCLDRFHPLIQSGFSGLLPQYRSNGTGKFLKQSVEKPDVVGFVPRRFSRYGLPITVVEQILSQCSPPDSIFVTSHMTYWYPGVMEMIAMLRKMFRAVPIVLGGIYASLCPDHARSVSGADVVMPGADAVAAVRMADDITGWGSDPPETDDHDIPLPLYALYPFLGSAALLTSQGCPYRCPFCASHLLTPRPARIRPNKIVDFIAALHDGRGVTEFAFFDDALFNSKSDHIIPLLSAMSDRHLPVHFHAPNGIQPREVDEETARLMHRAGFRTVRLSYESASPERQRAMGLKVSNEDLVQAVRHLFDAGFEPRQIGAYVLAGLPGQEAGEVVQSLRAVLDLGIKASLASFSPIPGTGSWQAAVDAGILNADSDPLLTNNTVFTYIGGSIPPDLFTTLTTLSSNASRLIDEGKHPFDDTEFAETFQRLEKIV